MLEATSSDKVISHNPLEESVTSDFSPSSDGATDNVIGDHYVEEEFYNNSDDDAIDGDSLDEGLGDISGEGDTSESPTPHREENVINHNLMNYNNNNTSEEAST